MIQLQPQLHIDFYRYYFSKLINFTSIVDISILYFLTSFQHFQPTHLHLLKKLLYQPINPLITLISFFLLHLILHQNLNLFTIALILIVSLLIIFIFLINQFIIIISLLVPSSF